MDGTRHDGARHTMAGVDVFGDGRRGYRPPGSTSNPSRPRPVMYPPRSVAWCPSARRDPGRRGHGDARPRSRLPIPVCWAPGTGAHARPYACGGAGHGGHRGRCPRPCQPPRGGAGMRHCRRGDARIPRRTPRRPGTGRRDRHGESRRRGRRRGRPEVRAPVHRRARADHPIGLFRAKYAAEQYPRQRPGLDHRAAERLHADLGGDRRGSAARRACHRLRPRKNPINFVAVDDVAAVVERAATDPTLSRMSVDAPGPQNLTMNQFAEHLGATRIRHIPRSALTVLATAAKPIRTRRSRDRRAPRS